MKPACILVVLGILTAVPLHAPAGGAKSEVTAGGADEKSSPEGKKKYGVPPGMLKKGALPPGQAKKQSQETLEADVEFPFQPTTNLVASPRPARGPAVDDKRVESPRGAEVLPQPTPAPASSARPEPQPALRAATAREDRELEAELLKVIVSRANPEQRNAALTRIASDTGTTPGALEAQMQGNAKLRGGDLLMGNKIAALSRKPVEEVFADHAKTGKWLATGFNFGVPPETLQKTAATFVSGKP